MYVEVNIDAIVGPSHHYGGVGVGNLASQKHIYQPSHPRQGALEGLRKAMLVADLGIPQFVLPPLRRPLPDLLPSLGFRGDFQAQCAKARQQAPSAYSATFSSAFMWAANAATVAPSCDSHDGHTHMTMANLSSSWHRMFEHAERQKQFEHLFASNTRLPVSIHSALPPLVPLRDEGAANHMRLCNAAGDIGIHIFVYGEDSLVRSQTRYLPRQTLAACHALARLHGLDLDHTFFLKQHPDVIDAGAFHNDVIATSHRNLLIMHEQAFFDAAEDLDRLQATFQRITNETLRMIVVRSDQLSLSDAVKSYLFNSQLLTPNAHDDAMTILCAAQCQRMPNVRSLIDSWIASPDTPISDARFVSLDQSMSGGGGPACLRLRVQLPEAAIESLNPAYR